GWGGGGGAGGGGEGGVGEVGGRDRRAGRRVGRRREGDRRAHGERIRGHGAGGDAHQDGAVRRSGGGRADPEAVEPRAPYGRTRRIRLDRVGQLEAAAGGEGRDREGVGGDRGRGDLEDGGRRAGAAVAD